MNIIFFNTIALGDYLIHSKIIRNIKKKYNCHITAVCSEYNARIIKRHKHINKIIIYNSDWSIFKKLNCLKEILKKKYYLSVVFDCQKFSMFANFLLKSEFKRGNLTVKNKSLFFFNYKKYYPPKYIGSLIYDKYTLHFKRNYVEKVIYIPNTWISLLKDFTVNNDKNEIYYFNPMKIEDTNKIKLLKKLNIKNYILFHFDNKWNDVNDINNKLFENLVYLQKKINKNILITSYMNKTSYFKNLKLKLNSIDSVKYNLTIKNNKRIYLVNDPSLFLQERLVSSSDYNISCHSGILVHGSGANKKKIIDVLNYEEVDYQKCWAPKKNYYVVLKKEKENKIRIDIIFNKIASIIKN